MSAPGPEVLAFLDAVKEHPEDDTPRLVLADWLEERGDPRGEFLRVHCRLAASPWGDPHGEDLARRKRELLAAHADDWTAPLAPYILDRHFRRGLLWVHTTARKLLGPGLSGGDPAFQAAWAWVEALTVRDLGDVPPETFASYPLLAGVARLLLRGNRLGPRGAAALAASPYLGRLFQLELASCGIGAEGALALARAASLPRLCELDLGSNDLGDEGAAALAGSRLLGQLRLLDLSYNGIGDRGARALADSPSLAPSLHLTLRMHNIGRAAGKALRRRFGDRVVL
jgi:uncharacterized protein (TIGR02996 family)